MQRKFISGAVMEAEGLGPRQIRVRASTGVVDRVGDVLVPKGCRLRTASVPVLLDHKATIDSIVGRAAVTVSDGEVEALITFAEGLPPTTQVNVDDALVKYKNGYATDVSVGFDPVETDRTKTGYLFRIWDLLELSLVVIGCNQEAVVTEKTLVKADADWKCGAARNLPLGKDDTWDGPAAEASIFAWAGGSGDDFDEAKARRGFLAYDAGNPDLRASYKLPFAKVVDGGLVAMPAALRAAASRLPQTDIPDAVKNKARAVLDHYEAMMSDERDDTDKMMGARMRKTISALRTKGLWQVGMLAGLLAELGWHREMAEMEALDEGDESKVPAMLADALKTLADAFLAMSAEEVREMLGGDDEDVATEGLDAPPSGLVQAGLVQAGSTPPARKLRLATVRHRKSGRIKSGRIISAASAETLKKALDAHDAALAHHQEATKCIKAARACVKSLVDSARSGGQDPDDDAEVDETNDETNDDTRSFEARQREKDRLVLAVI